MARPPKKNPCSPATDAGGDAPRLEPEPADERDAAREIILRRRAQFVAAALAAGVSAASCGGETTNDRTCLGWGGVGASAGFSVSGGRGGSLVCLSFSGGSVGSVGGTQPCLTWPPCLSGAGGEAGFGPCLSGGVGGVAGVGGAGGVGGVGDVGGIGPCLSGAGPCLSPPADIPGDGGIAGDGGVSGTGGGGEGGT